MRYEELQKLKEKKNGVGCICLFGAGLIGSTWAYCYTLWAFILIFIVTMVKNQILRLEME